jgi:hypothetical protein
MEQSRQRLGAAAGGLICPSGVDADARGDVAGPSGSRASQKEEIAGKAVLEKFLGDRKVRSLLHF